MLKKVLIITLGVIVALILVGFLLPSKFEITRSVSIKAPAEYTFEEINSLQNWDRWSYWNSLDTTMKVSWGESTIGQGGSYSWEGKEVGTGKLVITESVPFKTIKADLFFMDDTNASKAGYDFEPEGEDTKLTMTFTTDFGYNPFMRWLGVTMFPSEMEKAFNYNLTKLKEIAEAKPKFALKITEEEVNPVSYIGIAHTMSPQDPAAIVTQMEKMYTELFNVCQKAKVEMNGHPFAIYTAFSETSMSFIAAVPVSADAKVPSKYKVVQTTPVRAAKAVHMGSYDNMGATHDEIKRFIEFKKYQIAGAPWEVYVTDPTVEKDTAKWITEVYYPVSK